MDFICKECNRKFDYSKSKGHRKTICNSCIVMNKQKKNKQKAVEYKGGKCEICGYNKCIEALEFHHLGDKLEKPSYAIMKRSWDFAKKELDKCKMLCSNCHKEEHVEIIKLKRINNIITNEDVA